MFLFFLFGAKETFSRCILLSFYFFLQVCFRFSVILVQLKDNIGVPCSFSVFNDAVIMLIFQSLCLKLSLDKFATNIEESSEKIF